LSDAVLIERRGSVQIITMNRPAQLNALNAAIAVGVANAVDELDSSDELTVGVLTGAGRAFSTGMDLKAFLAGETPEVGDRGLCGITKSPARKPLIGAVEGWALAGGLEVLLACDLIVASDTACFGVPEVKRALVAGAGAAYLLPQRVPRAIALEMLLTGEPIDAARAAAIGLVNRTVPAGTALQAAIGIAEMIALNGPLAIAATKKIAGSSHDWTPAQWWARQPALMKRIMESEDAREGATAFLEDRTPVWNGR